MDILWKKTPLSVCILLYAVENSLFSVEKSTEFVDNPVEKMQQKRGSLSKIPFIVPYLIFTFRKYQSS